MVKRVVLAVACVTFGLGCESKIEVPPPATDDVGSASAVIPINIGDIEAQVHLYCDVPLDLGDAENIDVERRNTRVYDLGMITIDLYPPYPESIPLRIWLENKLRKLPVAVVLRGNIERDGTPIQALEYILTEDTGETTDIATADALAQLGAPPETVLVHATVDAVLLPPSTNVSIVNVQEVQGTPLTQSVLLSNPVRINFHPAQDAP